MIQIRKVPAAMRRELESRAALAGLSRSDYLPREMRQRAVQSTIDQLRARLEWRSAAPLSVSPADAIRAERDRR